MLALFSVITNGYLYYFENMDYFPHQNRELFKNLKYIIVLLSIKKNSFSSILVTISNTKSVIFVDVFAKTKKLN